MTFRLWRCLECVHHKFVLLSKSMKLVIKTVDCDNSDDGDEAIVNVKMHLKAGLHCEAVSGGLSAKWRAPTPPSRLTPVSTIS